MPADANKVDTGVFKSPDFLSKSLRRINMEIRVMICERLNYLFDGLNHTRFVVDMHYRHKKSIVSQRIRNLLSRNAPGGVDWQNRRFESVTHKMLNRLENSFVLNCRRYDMAPVLLPTFWCQPQNCQIVAFGRTASEHNFLSFGRN
jgi:hypothetical protein